MADTDRTLIDPTDPKPDAFRATAAAFSQVGGVLGGFSVTVFVQMLSVPFPDADAWRKDSAIGLTLVAAFLYVTSALLLANSMNPVPPQLTVRSLNANFNLGIILLHVGNILLLVGLLILFTQFVGRVSLVIAGVAITVAAVVLVVNLLAGGRRPR